MSESTLLQIEDGPGGLRLVGEIDATSAPLLGRRLDPLPEGDQDIVVDLSAVGFIDSSGLRTLIDAHRRAASAGRRLIMARPSPVVSRLFEISGLNPHLHIEPA